jgi:ribosome biogenesis GTPase A
MDIQWFPGHMAKTEKLIADNVKLVDIVLEVIDARIPASSRNPRSDALIGNKKRIIVMSKSDLADPSINKKWVDHYKKIGIDTIMVDAVSGTGINKLLDKAKDLVYMKEISQKAKGRIHRPVKLMVIGVPNVGKSTLINAIVKKKVTNTADKPGVTKQKQWVRVDSDFALLDMPGVLWPKFDDEKTGYYLAFTGGIKDEVLDIQILAVKLIGALRGIDKNIIEKRYGIELNDDDTDIDVFDKMSVRRGYIIKGGTKDRERCAKILLDEYRGGMLGRITLEEPEG